MTTTTKPVFPFDVKEFREDITNNVEFKDLKAKYKQIKTRVELQGYIYRLSELDDKMYRYTFSPSVRSVPVSQPKDGSIKINKITVDQFKSELGCETFEFGTPELVDGKIVIEVSAA